MDRNRSEAQRHKQESYNKDLLLLNVFSPLSEETVCCRTAGGGVDFFFFFLVKQFQVLLKASSELFTSAAVPETFSFENQMF